MKYNLCVPIPIRYTSFKEVKHIIEKANKANPDLIELRFDYLSNYKTLSMEFIRNLLDSISPHVTTIFTFRKSTEGGRIHIKEDERMKIYKMFLDAKPNYIDLEMDIDNEIIDEIINLANEKGVGTIFSYHNFERTLSFNEATNLIEKFNKRMIQELILNPKMLEGTIKKIVFTAQSFEDNLTPLRLCRQFSSSNQRIISFCMGSLGIFSRINCVFAGSYLTYAFLEEETAQGQINIKKMREIYDLIID
ncbi:MAG: type I 3-dehydroquinate dehydratase [Candidatus Hodarchaeota archaeon]